MKRSLAALFAFSLFVSVPSFAQDSVTQPTTTTAPPASTGPKQPVLDATDRLTRKLNTSQRRAKIFKISSIVLASMGGLGGGASIISAKVVNDPALKESIGQIGGLSSLLSSALGILFNFEAKAGKNKDCLSYLQKNSQEFTAKWTNGVPPERATEFEADKDKIENGHDGKCGKRLELY